MRVLSMMITCISIFLNTSIAASVELSIPPLPEQSEVIAIAMLKRDIPIDCLESFSKEYPSVKVRQVYQQALHGGSISGSSQDLERLAQDNRIEKLTIASMYEASALYIGNSEQGDNLKLIGSEKARGLFDQQHERLTGKGIKVGVIDTGVDYLHPDLRKNYGGGWDVVDNDRDPMETTGTKRLRTLHGTHVAGIIAANGRIQGVAPESTIIAYRALGGGGIGSTEQVLAAIDQAIVDKVDILNLSLGNSVNGPDLPLSIALNTVVDKGIVAITSSGNSGPHVWSVGSPGTASKAISVGASTPTMSIPYLICDDEEIRLEHLQGSAQWRMEHSYELIDAGIGQREQLKNAKGKIVLIQRGTLTFSEKARNAKEAGAVAVIIYNHLNGVFSGSLEEEESIPVMSMEKEFGQKLSERLKRGSIRVRAAYKQESDKLAHFSSRGPVTVTWEMKPDLVAPGVAIQSTIPGGYLSMQGTSMAAPHVAGAAALIKQAHPDWQPEQVKAALMNYAKILERDKGRPYRTYEQGAGRIQVEKAIKAPLLVYPSSLTFGRFKGTEKHKQSLTIENTSEIEQTISFLQPERKQGLEWHLPMMFMLESGEKRSVDISLTVDDQWQKSKIDDGRITMTFGQESIHIPFIFVTEEPNYPRVMGFEYCQTGGYEVYLPSGADEFGIALFDPDTYQFISFLDWKRNVGNGLLSIELDDEKLPVAGIYKAVIFARKYGREDRIETEIEISKERQ